MAQSGSALMRGVATGLDSKADIGAPLLPQLSFMSTRPEVMPHPRERNSPTRA